ncbi:MAG: cyclopropane fatty acyl phospholipid synthase [Candidatus Berkiellales bacterium]
MEKIKQAIGQLLSEAGITLNGNQPWDMTVHQDQFYSLLLKNVELNIGETYVDGMWDCPHLDQLFDRILSINLDKTAIKHPLFWQSAIKQSLTDFFLPFLNNQTIKKSLVVGKKHYDVGNDLYQKMLDKRMVYTCAYWEGANNLDEAQEKKLQLTCEKLNLKPGMTLLDIGCGWGSLAKYAAEKYGVSVVGLTISQEQAELAKQSCAGLPVEIRFQDYRRLQRGIEQFDRIASLGMFEHVGSKNYRTYMEVIAHCLKNDGLFLLQTIGTNCQRQAINAWINTYIFPNGELPTLGRISRSFEDIFVMEDWQNVGIYYDKTLMAWHHNFNTHWDSLKEKYDERFRRLWNYYLLSNAGAFRARRNQLWQIVLSKKGLRQGFQRPVLSAAKHGLISLFS